jgi:Putative bacterial sensory transduction regulator
MRALIIAVLLTALSGAATHLYAQKVDASDPSQIAAILQDLGFRAKLDTTTSNTPRIESSSGGKFFYVYFVGCNEGINCKAINFSTYWIFEKKIPIEKVNAWNLEKFVGKAFLDKDGDVFLQFFVNLDMGGVQKRNFQDTLEWWQLALGQFGKYIIE